MDQAKFAWPRASFFHSHVFDKFIRPRLHITGCIAHGYFVLIVNDADVKKSGSNACVIIGIALQLFG